MKRTKAKWILRPRTWWKVINVPAQICLLHVMKVKSMLRSGVSAWLELFVVGRVSKPHLIILQGDQWWGVKWRTGGVLTWHFLIQNTAGNPKSFSQASTLALLHSQWSFSVHWAEVIRFPTHTVSSSVNDISSDRVHNIEAEKGVIVIENIACGCSYQWHPPSMHSCMHS